MAGVCSEGAVLSEGTAFSEGTGDEGTDASTGTGPEGRCEVDLGSRGLEEDRLLGLDKGTGDAVADTGVYGFAGAPPSSSRTLACTRDSRIWKLAASASAKKQLARRWRMGESGDLEGSDMVVISCAF